MRDDILLDRIIKYWARSRAIESVSEIPLTISSVTLVIKDRAA